MALLAAACLAAGVATATAIGGHAARAARGRSPPAPTFQALRVPVGRAASWMLDR